MPAFAITLKPANRPAVLVVLPANEHGELPAVMINPRDISGTTVRGMWLQSEEDPDDYARIAGSGWHG